MPCAYLLPSRLSHATIYLKPVWQALLKVTSLTKILLSKVMIYDFHINSI